MKDIDIKAKDMVQSYRYVLGILFLRIYIIVAFCVILCSFIINPVSNDAGIVLSIIARVVAELTFFSPWMITLGLFICYVFVPLSVKAQLKPPRSRLVGKAVDFSEEGVEEISEAGNMKFRWKDFHSFRRLQNQFLLFIAPRQYIILPIRNFNDAELEFVTAQLRTAGVKARGWF